GNQRSVTTQVACDFDPGKPLLVITSQAQDYSTIFADCATGFCLICTIPCNPAWLPSLAAWRQAGARRTAWLRRSKMSELRRSETIARNFWRSGQVDTRFAEK
ncbi:hypothetical protein, partial [Achromobacter sp. LC458]|uniref:hypothetical protein n=1 Tax=Achromobacter sp. LC458 TaxID=1120623 RepID=UPI001C8F6E5C